jgi:hypothetical protein
MTRSDGRPSSRRGAVMVQFAMLAFGFFALAAVVIDMRLASYTQQQMQTASDSAALEALRQRDEFGVAQVRATARDSIEYIFDDDLNASNGDPLRIGAGPVLRLTGGTAVDNASALLTVPQNPVYDPVLQLNASNEQSGDVVTGAFDPDADHSESFDYSRADFTPAAAAATNAQAVLVRLRRTNDVDGLDQVAGTSSSGPTIPFLFGLGSTIHRSAGSSYNPRTDGVTVRSTSIAAERRALEVSGPGPAYGKPPLQRFVLFSGGVHVRAIRRTSTRCGRTSTSTRSATASS